MIPRQIYERSRDIPLSVHERSCNATTLADTMTLSFEVGPFKEKVEFWKKLKNSLWDFELFVYVSVKEYIIYTKNVLEKDSFSNALLSEINRYV